MFKAPKDFRLPAKWPVEGWGLQPTPAHGGNRTFENWILNTTSFASRAAGANRGYVFQDNL